MLLVKSAIEELEIIDQPYIVKTLTDIENCKVITGELVELQYDVELNHIQITKHEFDIDSKKYFSETVEELKSLVDVNFDDWFDLLDRKLEYVIKTKKGVKPTQRAARINAFKEIIKSMKKFIS
jgi:hypothetical protein